MRLTNSTAPAVTKPATQKAAATTTSGNWGIRSAAKIALAGLALLSQAATSFCSEFQDPDKAVSNRKIELSNGLFSAEITQSDKATQITASGTLVSAVVYGAIYTPVFLMILTPLACILYSYVRNR